MTKTLLRESTATPLAKTGKRWRGILAVPGVGSSGTYTESVLREFGPAAVAPGAKAFIDHDPKRSPKDMIGTYPDGAVYEDGVGLVGELEVFPHWADFVEAVGPHAGLSIYMMGETDSQGNVVKLIPDRQNGIDLVSYAGLDGSGLAEKLYESAKASAELAENGSASAGRTTQSKEDSIMELAELAGKVDKLTESVTTLVANFSTLAESLKPVAVTPEVADLGAVAEAAIKAGIPEEMRQEIYETVKEMAPAAALDVVAKRKALVESIAKQIKESATPVVTAGIGRVVEGQSAVYSMATDFGIKVGA